MGNIILQSVVVKAKTAGIKKKIQSEILDGNKKNTKKLKQFMKNSKGQNVDALKEQMDKESQLVNGLGDLLTDMVEYIDMICDEFEQLDRKYASPLAARIFKSFKS